MSRSVGLFAYVLLVVSLLFPWVYVSTSIYHDRLTLYDIKVYRDAVSGACFYLGLNETACGLSSGLVAYINMVIVVMLVLGLVASIVPEIYAVNGVLGLVWTGLIYDDPAKLFTSKYSFFIRQFVSLDLGFYLFMVSSIVFLIAGIIGLYERLRKSKSSW